MRPLFFFIVGVFAMSSASLAQPAMWDVDEMRSSLSFVFEQEGESFKGDIEKFSSDIRFDVGDLAQSIAHITIDLTSLSAGNAERDDALQSSDWFYLSKFPQAEFKTTELRQLGDRAFEADAVLSIRGIEKKIVLPFTLDFEGEDVHMVGALDMNRLDFGLGEGFWANPDFIGLSVIVRVEIFARRALSNADG